MRLVRDAKIDRLAQLPVFADCPLEELAAVAAVGEHLTVPRFREVTREGRTRDGLVYVLLRGMVQLKRGDRVLAYLQDGDVVGQLDLLDDGAGPGLTVTTVVDTELLLLERRHLGPLLHDNPAFAERLDRLADRRRAA